MLVWLPYSMALAMTEASQSGDYIHDVTIDRRDLRPRPKVRTWRREYLNTSKQRFQMHFYNAIGFNFKEEVFQVENQRFLVTGKLH